MGGAYQYFPRKYTLHPVVYANEIELKNTINEAFKSKKSIRELKRYNVFRMFDTIATTRYLEIVAREVEAE